LKQFAINSLATYLKKDGFIDEQVRKKVVDSFKIDLDLTDVSEIKTGQEPTKKL